MTTDKGNGNGNGNGYGFKWFLVVLGLVQGLAVPWAAWTTLKISDLSSQIAVLNKQLENSGDNQKMLVDHEVRLRLLEREKGLP